MLAFSGFGKYRITHKTAGHDPVFVSWVMDGLIMHTKQTAPKAGGLEWSVGLAFVPTQKQPGAQGQMLLIVSALQVWKDPGLSPVRREIQLIPDSSCPGREQQD